MRLTPEDQARLARVRAAKPETVEAYLRGMHHWWQWSEEGTTNALHYFQKAIALGDNHFHARHGHQDGGGVCGAIAGPLPLFRTCGEVKGHDGTILLAADLCDADAIGDEW